MLIFRGPAYDVHDLELRRIYKTWERSFAPRSAFSPMGKVFNGRGLKRGAWSEMHRAHIRRTVDGFEVAVAVEEREPDVLLGWACWDAVRKVLHYVFVEEPLRRHGVATQMLAHVGWGRDWSASHMTPEGEALLAAQVVGVKELQA